MYPKIKLDVPGDEEIAIDPERLIDIRLKMPQIMATTTTLLTARVSGPFRLCAYYLPDHYDWVIGRDSEGFLSLVPLKKEEKNG